MRIMKTKFDDLEAAFEEMEYLVGETNLSHQIVSSHNKEDVFIVVQKGNASKQGVIYCELNIRNIVGESLLNLRRGFKPERRRVSGIKRALS